MDGFMFKAIRALDAELRLAKKSASTSRHVSSSFINCKSSNPVNEFCDRLDGWFILIELVVDPSLLYNLALNEAQVESDQYGLSLMSLCRIMEQRNWMEQNSYDLSICFLQATALTQPDLEMLLLL